MQHTRCYFHGSEQAQDDLVRQNHRAPAPAAAATAAAAAVLERLYLSDRTSAASSRLQLQQPSATQQPRLTAASPPPRQMIHTATT
jgi:hypothetical protein